MFYRIVDKPDALYPSPWQGPIAMVNNGGRKFLDCIQRRRMLIRMCDWMKPGLIFSSLG